jgi:hypothetical protein
MEMELSKLRPIAAHPSRTSLAITHPGAPDGHSTPPAFSGSFLPHPLNEHRKDNR